jgi:hydrogenase nickel incorporation protein HypA/HybF
MIAPPRVALVRLNVHELSIVLSLVEAIEAKARDLGIERVTGVHLRVGSFSGVVPDALRFTWEAATAETVAASSALLIEEVPLVVYCETCRGERQPNAGAGIACPSCEHPARRIVSGRELELVAIEIPQ